jgi:hypothetical protein
MDRHTTKTVFILDRPDGFFFFDPKKEGIAFDVRRWQPEDNNVTTERTLPMMTNLTTAAKILIEPETLRWLQPFPVMEKHPFFNRQRPYTIRPVVVTTQAKGSVSVASGMSHLNLHPFYVEFLEQPVSFH